MGRPRPPVADWLAYLGEIGYGEIYRRSSGHAAISEEVAPPVAVPGPLPADDGREEALAELAGRVAVCTACGLSETRNRTVFGTGPLGARLMVIGEGPGAEEDRQGLPFVGRAGELLTKILLAIGLTREEVYIANIVKCRPPGNRAPEPAEVTACIGYLERQIEIVRPTLLVALGKTAAQVLLGANGSLAELRGPWYEYRGVPLKVTYHPAALLRNPALKRPTWEDMQEGRDRLGRAGRAPGGGA